MPDLSAAIADMRKTFCGRLLLPPDEGYDDARSVFNAMVDRRPTVIAQCRNLADISDAVRLGRAHDLEIAVRGGGHNVAGRATVEAGLNIDLSLMRGVHVDRRARTARVEGGATWKDVNRATQVHGLATTGGVVSTTGVAGLTLGGGLGWLMPRYGMALDNVRSFEMVDATGAAAPASADENPDLFWALRGGGGNFGVVGSFEFDVHAVGPTIIGGLVAWPFTEAGNVLRFFRDFAATVPDEVFLLGAATTGPDGTKLVAMAAAHCGPLADGERVLAPIKAFGRPVMDVLGPLPYSQLNMMFDDGLRAGSRNYWKSHFLSTLTDAAIDTFVTQFARCPSPQTQAFFEHFHGAPTRLSPTDTAYALRSNGFNLAIVSIWPNAAGDAANIQWTRETYRAFQPHVGSNRYLNYMDQDDADDAVLAAVYGPNLARLKRVKKQYDPDNVFHLNVNIRPA
jgi:FAD/FMN-containing dehydrogenase